MKNSMREFILKVILVQEFLDPVTNDWILQDLIDVGSLVGLGIQQGLKDVLDVLAEMRWDLRIFTNDNFSSKLMQRLGVEWGM